MSCRETAAAIACGSEQLVGILAEPKTPPSVGVIVVVGGPQYRAGSHRQFVLLARTLAAGGYAVLRFDYRGMGDSTGAVRPFTDASADIAAAITALRSRVPSVTQVVLWGLCDGASAALLYCHDTQDPRVSGLCLLNPWVRSEASLARTHVKHYYWSRLKQREFWAKFFSGKVAGSALGGLWRNVRLMKTSAAPPGADTPFQQRMALAWGRDGDRGILLLLSSADYTAKEFVEYASTDTAWKGLLERSHVVRRDIPNADHTLSDTASRTEVEALTLRWLDQHARR